MLSAPIAEAAQVAEMPAPILAEHQWTQGELEDLVDRTATQQGLNATRVKAVIKCESNWNYRAVGDNGKAHGLVQIRTDYNDVSTSEANDPVYAVNFLEKEWKAGHADHWTCYRNQSSTRVE